MNVFEKKELRARRQFVYYPLWKQGNTMKKISGAIEGRDAAMAMMALL